MLAGDAAIASDAALLASLCVPNAGTGPVLVVVAATASAGATVKVSAVVTVGMGFEPGLGK